MDDTLKMCRDGAAQTSPRIPIDNE